MTNKQQQKKTAKMITTKILFTKSTWWRVATSQRSSEAAKQGRNRPLVEINKQLAYTDLITDLLNN